MKRMYLKKKRKNNISGLITIIFVLIMIFVIYLLKIFNDKAIPQFMSYSMIETKKIVSSVIDSTVMEETYKNTDLDNLFVTTKDNDGNIRNIDFNPTYVNQILVNTYKSVQRSLMYLEKGNVEKLNLYNYNLSTYKNNKLKKGVIYELPSGIIFNNVILNNLFPKIPVKIDLIGNIFCRLDTDIKSYGINNALITVNVVVEVEIKILLPFISENTKIVESIPIIMKIVEGEIPSYYFDRFLSSPSITKSVD